MTSLCEADPAPAPSVALAGGFGPELQDLPFGADPVPPHAPLIFTGQEGPAPAEESEPRMVNRGPAAGAFDTDIRRGADRVAWATGPVSLKNGVAAPSPAHRLREAGVTVQMTAVHCTVYPLLSPAAADGLTHRFEIIPRDGLGFDPGSTLTLQMLSRAPMLQGFPYPPSSVSTDGQALTSPYLNDITIAEVRIDAISDATHFSPPEFATVTSSLFQGVVELVAGATQTLGLFTRSLDAAGHPASPLVYVDTASALGAGEVTIGLEPPAVRSGPGMIEVWDADRLDHWDYAFYDWQPPWRIVSPSDGDDQQVRDEVAVDIVLPDSPYLQGFILRWSGFEHNAAEQTLKVVPQHTTTYAAGVDLPFGWSTLLLTDLSGVPLDARTVRISEDVIGAPIVVWRMCDAAGGTANACNGFGPDFSYIDVRRIVDNIEIATPPTFKSVDDIWTQANIQHRLVEVRVIAHPELWNRLKDWTDVQSAGYDASAFNVYLYSENAVLFDSRDGAAEPNTRMVAVRENDVKNETYVLAHELGHLWCLLDLYNKYPGCPGELSDRLMCCEDCYVIEDDEIDKEITFARTCFNVEKVNEND